MLFSNKGQQGQKEPEKGQRGQKIPKGAERDQQEPKAAIILCEEESWIQNILLHKYILQYIKALIFYNI